MHVGEHVVWSFRPDGPRGGDLVERTATIVKLNPKMIRVRFDADGYERNVAPDTLRPIGSVGQGNGDLL